MTARIGKALSFSNIIACLALFVAFGGTVYAAGKISGKQIKPSSLPGNRIKPRTVAASRIKPKTLTGRQIKANSLSGREIDQKTLTQVRAAGLASVQYQVTTVPLSNTSRTGATVGCPPATHVIGGGATVSNEEEAFVNDSGPTPQQTGWTATGFSETFGNTMTVTAICVVVDGPDSTVSRGTGSIGPVIPEYHPTR